jgi:hypothetical protein
MIYSRTPTAPEQAIIDETLDQFRQFDPELFALLNGNLEKYSTKETNKIVVLRIARELGISYQATLLRLQALRDHLGTP